MATTLLDKQAKKAAYIRTANVQFYGDYAMVSSEFEENKTYRVQIVGGVSTACDCPDYYWRSQRDPSHVCKHMEAVDLHFVTLSSKAA